jgi:hypothetical protein
MFTVMYINIMSYTVVSMIFSQRFPAGRLIISINYNNSSR